MDRRVFCEIRVLPSFAGKRPPTYYYRDTDGKEIDLLLERNNTLYPIEIKKSANPKKNAIRNFAVLEKTGKEIGEGCVYFIEYL